MTVCGAHASVGGPQLKITTAALLRVLHFEYRLCGSDKGEVMSWTEERVGRLSRLWLEGRSASQIAAELGEGVSRNAVIGKVHRLGLSGRAAVPPTSTPVEPAPMAVAQAVGVTTEPSQARAEPPRARPEPQADVTPVAPAPVSAEAEPVEAAPVAIAFDMPVLRSIKDVVIPLSGRVTILELGATMCRWPLGDPTSAEFRFCGCRAAGSMPYCSEHARVAFQPVADRRRVERMARIA